MAQYRILTWHSIPTGVRAWDGDGEVRETLPRRFQIAVDAVATATGRTGTQAYLAGWQWSAAQEREGSAEEVARTVAAELERAYDAARVKEIRRELEQSLADEPLTAQATPRSQRRRREGR